MSQNYIKAIKTIFLAMALYNCGMDCLQPYSLNYM